MSRTFPLFTCLALSFKPDIRSEILRRFLPCLAGKNEFDLLLNIQRWNLKRANREFPRYSTGTSKQILIFIYIIIHNQRFILPTLYRLKISKLIRLQSIEEANINSLPLLDSSRTTIRSPSISLSRPFRNFAISQDRARNRRKRRIGKRRRGSDYSGN